MMLWLVMCCLVCSLDLNPVEGQDKELRLLGIQAMTGRIWPGGWSCLVPVMMAIDEVNQRSDLLDGYKLTYNYIDHEVRFVFNVNIRMDILYELCLYSASTPYIAMYTNSLKQGFLNYMAYIISKLQAPINSRHYVHDNIFVQLMLV